ncbi:MAG: acyltransferase family protein [Thermoanaerobaculia bacterium]
MNGGALTRDESLASAPVSSTRRVHLPALDGLRGVGILVVMITHFSRVNASDASVSAGLRSAVDVSTFALPMFFVLSGFLITGILLEAREKSHYFRNFFIRRALRILPLYYGVLAVLFILRPSWGRALGGTSSPIWLWTYVANIEMARHGHCTYAFLCNFWSLTVEEQYYLFWPFVVFALGPRKLLAACAALGVGAVALRVAFAFDWHNVGAAYVLTPCQLDPLCAGGALAILVRKWPPERYRGLARIAVAGSLAVFLVLGWYRKSGMGRELVVGRPLLSCFLFGGIILLSIGETGFLRTFLGARPLTFLGKYSYGLYVFHSPLIPLFGVCFSRARLASALGSPLAGLGISVLLSISACLLLSIASYEVYEKRFLRLKVRFEV